jgi:nitrous oxide reductase
MSLDRREFLGAAALWPADAAWPAGAASVRGRAREGVLTAFDPEVC